MYLSVPSSSRHIPYVSCRSWSDSARRSRERLIDAGMRLLHDVRSAGPGGPRRVSLGIGPTEWMLSPLCAPTIRFECDPVGPGRSLSSIQAPGR